HRARLPGVRRFPRRTWGRSSLRRCARSHAAVGADFPGHRRGDPDSHALRLAHVGRGHRYRRAHPLHRLRPLGCAPGVRYLRRLRDARHRTHAHSQHQAVARRHRAASWPGWRPACYGLMTIGVLGATSWGVTLAFQLARNGHAVALLVRTPAEAQEVDSRRGIARLPEVTLPDTVTVQPVDSPVELSRLVVASPAQSLRESVAPLPTREVPVLSVAKGIEHGTRLRMSEVLRESGWPIELVAVLSGPNLAREVAAGLPAAAVVAAHAEPEALAWQEALSGGAFRVYRSGDVIGVELGGALKNVIAI